MHSVFIYYITLIKYKNFDVQLIKWLDFLIWLHGRKTFKYTHTVHCMHFSKATESQ